MELGICGDYESAQAIRDAGYSFLEMGVGARLCPLDKDAFAQSSQQADALPLPVPVCNCLVPGTMKILGPEADTDALASYIRKVAQNANTAGVEKIVFGSGGARTTPDGMDPAEAWAQLKTFCTLLATEGAKENVIFLMEHLRQEETNMINTVTDGARMVREVNQPNFRLLVDSYHWAVENEPVSSIEENVDLIGHVHVATRENRFYPGAEAFDFAPFLQALKQGGYDGRISIEGKSADPQSEYVPAAEVLRAAWG